MGLCRLHWKLECSYSVTLIWAPTTLQPTEVQPYFEQMCQQAFVFFNYFIATQRKHPESQNFNSLSKNLCIKTE